MSVFAITMVRNEEALIGDVIGHLLAEGIDHVIVADNLSSDRTRPILDELAARLPVTVVDDPEPAYLQAEKMTRLADMAREMGATWIVPFDADELWVAADGQTLADVLRASGDADVLQAAWLQRTPPLLPYRKSSWAKMTRRQREPDGMVKVAFRALPGVRLLQGNHQVVGVDGLRVVTGRVLVHHYRWRGFGHFVRKNRQGKAAMEAAGDRLDAGWSWEWRLWGGYRLRSLAKLYVRMVVDERRAGTVVDPVLPRTATSSTSARTSR